MGKTTLHSSGPAVSLGLKSGVVASLAYGDGLLYPCILQRLLHQTLWAPFQLVCCPYYFSKQISLPTLVFLVIEGSPLARVPEVPWRELVAPCQFNPPMPLESLGARNESRCSVTLCRIPSFLPIHLCFCMFPSPRGKICEKYSGHLGPWMAAVPPGCVCSAILPSENPRINSLMLVPLPKH